ncbi:MAG: hypothetical protein P0Y55_12155 [Candidatus Cohnella colombiensis]|uniref:Uncharacterized protein n=1 Tax=Candidatus Cohnella colombiensis TaxID=3121368 RepID=A0AA95EWQ6_9BACL|nr:MAG: hypothetical protein P0Y55_12155 [Cohnella sp.]
MPYTFPTDSTGKAGAVVPNAGGNSFHVPVVLYGPDGVTPLSSTQRLPVDSLPVGRSSLKATLQNVTTAGLRERLPSVACSEVTVIARKGNTGSIYVGGSDVSSTVFGVEFKANESFTFPVSNANMIYIDASVSGEGVSYVAL